MPAGAATSAGFLLGAGLRSRVGCPKTKPTDQADANDDATCGSIRLKFLKIEALVRISARRIKIAMAAACPAADEWGLAARRAHLTRIAAARRQRGITSKPTEPKNQMQQRRRRHHPARHWSGPPKNRLRVALSFNRVRNAS